MACCRPGRLCWPVFQHLASGTDAGSNCVIGRWRQDTVIGTAARRTLLLLLWSVIELSRLVRARRGVANISQGQAAAEGRQAVPRSVGGRRRQLAGSARRGDSSPHPNRGGAPLGWPLRAASRPSSRAGHPGQLHHHFQRHRRCGRPHAGGVPRQSAAALLLCRDGGRRRQARPRRRRKGRAARQQERARPGGACAEQDRVAAMAGQIAFGATEGQGKGKTLGFLNNKVQVTGPLPPSAAC